MENQKHSIPVPEGSFEGDVTTWALPNGAIARLGKGNSVHNDIIPGWYASCHWMLSRYVVV